MFISLSSATLTYGVDTECFFQCRELISKSHTSYSRCYMHCCNEKKGRLVASEEQNPEESASQTLTWHSIPKIIGSPEGSQQLLGRANDAVVDSDIAFLSWSNKKKVDDQNIDTSGDDSTTEY
jgi:hypothetical protein